jgi:DNA-binding response OmpR family regulator
MASLLVRVDELGNEPGSSGDTDELSDSLAILSIDIERRSFELAEEGLPLADIERELASYLCAQLRVHISASSLWPGLTEWNE